MRVQVPFYMLLFTLLLFLSHQTFPQIIINSKQNLTSIYKPPVFEEITIADGLPEDSGTRAFEDYLGYLWLGTQNGLVQYDGYTMKVYLPEKDNLRSISNGYIITIYEDKNKNLWIGTVDGLNKFNRASESFERFTINVDDTLNVDNNWVRCMFEDDSGRFWIGTHTGINLFDPEKGSFTYYYFIDSDVRPYLKSARSYHKISINNIMKDPSTGKFLIATDINGLWTLDLEAKTLSKYPYDEKRYTEENIGCVQSFFKSNDEKIWIATDNSLLRLDPFNNLLETFINFPRYADEQYDKHNPFLGHVFQDKDGLVWCGFYRGEQGIFCLNPTSGEVLQFDVINHPLKKALFNQILSMYEDRSGIIWIGIHHSAFVKFDKRKNQFKLINSDENLSANSLSSSIVYSGIYDPDGFIWYSTKNGLDKYDIKNATIKHYLTDEPCITKSYYVSIKDKDGYLWLGTKDCGLIRFDPRYNTYQFYLSNPEEKINLVNKAVWALHPDHLGYIWIGTDYFGLIKFDPKNNKATLYEYDPNDPSSLSNILIKQIYEDSFKTLWIGTNNGGLDRYDRENEKFSNYGFYSINTIFEDSKGKFWVGEYFTGLNLFDREKGIIQKTYNERDGLLQNLVISIQEDDHYNLWIATQLGLSKFNPQTGRFRNYTKEDGFPDVFTTRTMSFKTPDGNMYFNTTAGQIVFHPDSIKDDPTPPKVLLSSISLFNRPDEKISYEGFISELDEITLPYDQNDLHFEFVGLHFSAPEKNKYKYILENFDENWVDAGNQRNATYTNLDPGEYFFRVTASNKDGYWNEKGASIKIIITPPWWKTSWAYLFYFLLIGSIIYLTWKAQVKRIRIKSEFEMSRFEAQKLHEVDEMKSRFFTNISHEFRTPLTMILGPVKMMIEKLNEGKMKDDLSLVHRNANKLLELVNQLLDISKLESGNMKLQAAPRNIIPLLKALVLSFTSYAERKKITLKFYSDKDEVVVYFDKDKIEKIITNILSNAFKFTPDGGSIEVTVSCYPEFISGSQSISSNSANLKIPKQARLPDRLVRDDQFVEISIRDTGVGIPKDKLDKIFDRFYQVDSSHTREQEGTGIGLSLTKELVELHKGSISVESEEGEGTTVTVSIPLGKEHLKPEEILEAYEEKDEKIFDYEEAETKTKGVEVEIKYFENESLPLVLIVEDNSDVRYYIKDNIKKEYKIIEAVDGEDGWNKSAEEIPDLIISDIMMPVMDGFQLCQKLKTDERTSHIPVILLTAKAAMEDKLEGLETGADDYIMKPFEPDELRARIKNLVEQRKRLQKYFQSKGIFDLSGQKITSVDKKFMQKVFDVILSRISDSPLNVEFLADELLVSRPVLHRKILSLTGETPGELIRRIRLNKAAELIKLGFGNLSEISLEVGFNNPVYFSEAFKKQFGVSPSQYQRNNKDL